MQSDETHHRNTGGALFARLEHHLRQVPPREINRRVGGADDEVVFFRRGSDITSNKRMF